MKSKKVTRYYCDFCHKGMFREGAMKKHERGCTANKNRICGVCSKEHGQQPLTRLLAALDGITEENKDEKMKELDYITEGCPACIFTALRHHPKTSIKLEQETGHVTVDYDIKKAMEVFREDEWKANAIAAEKATYL